VTIHVPASRAGLFHTLWAEAELTVRLVADNAIAAFLPGLLCTAAACVHNGLGATAMAGRLAEALALFFLYLYVFDASNQAYSGQEDRTNKPYRPIPAGLVTTGGLMRRFWTAMILYTVLGLLTGTLPFVLLWQATSVAMNLLSAPRHYLYVKPVAMVVGILAQLGAAWRLAGPLDHIAWTWIVTLAVAINLPLRIEDVRDMDGDRHSGRTTLPLLIGHMPVRLWFALVCLLLPLTIHLLLFTPSRPATLILVTCDTLMIIMAWTAAALTLYPRTPRTDRVAYQLYCLTYCAVLACGIAIL
jgi:4-hydroxybenzoate polyprenyltransferase